MAGEDAKPPPRSGTSAPEDAESTGADTGRTRHRRGVALNAIRALGRLGNPAARNPLCELLNSTDYTVREEAARSLGRLRDPAAVPGNRRLIESGTTVAGGEQAGSPLL